LLIVACCSAYFTSGIITMIVKFQFRLNWKANYERVKTEIKNEILNFIHILTQTEGIRWFYTFLSSQFEHLPNEMLVNGSISHACTMQLNPSAEHTNVYEVTAFL
jgi:hypothetical protein